MPAGGAEKRNETTDMGAKMSSKREFMVYGVVVYTDHPNLLGGGKWECLRVEGGRALAGMHFRGYVKTMPDRPCLLLGLTDDECVFRLAAYIPDLEPYINGRGDISVETDGPQRAFVLAVSEVDGQTVQLNDCPVIEVVE